MSNVVWHDTLDSSLDAARSGGLPVLVDFHAAPR